MCWWWIRWHWNHNEFPILGRGFLTAVLQLWVKHMTHFLSINHWPMMKRYVFPPRLISTNRYAPYHPRILHLTSTWGMTNSQARAARRTLRQQGQRWSQFPGQGTKTVTTASPDPALRPSFDIFFSPKGRCIQPQLHFTALRNSENSIMTHDVISQCIWNIFQPAENLINHFCLHLATGREIF